MNRLHVIRAVAIVIAVAGAIDPAITRDRTTRPAVALLAADRLPDPSLPDRVADVLDSRFTVIRGPALGAAATLLVGDQWPDAARAASGSAFAVRPEAHRPFVAIEAIDHPVRAQVESEIPLTVRVRADQARGRTLIVALSAGGVTLDRATRTIDADSATVSAVLACVAVAPGSLPLVVTATLDGADSDARADVAIDVHRRRWSVLVVDRRPSWMSTFVRRALEADPQFHVTSRISTSRGATSDAGAPPPDLLSPSRLSRFDAILIGAAEDLTPPEVAGLETFLRQRGGGIALLLDQASEAKPFMQLLGTTTWRRIERAEPIGRPPASSFFLPTTLPPGAIVIPETPPAPTPDAAPVAFWRLPVGGGGRVLVNSAIDAWRYRDREAGAFDRFWRLAIAELADATPPALALTLDRTVVAPGESTVIREWPSGDSRVVRAPLEPGPVPIAVDRAGATASAALQVVEGARQPTPDDRALIDAWTASRGGGVIPEGSLADLRPAIERALAPARARDVWHPMRSVWWLIPFAAALGSEWWTRRKQGWR